MYKMHDIINARMSQPSKINFPISRLIANGIATAIKYTIPSSPLSFLPIERIDKIFSADEYIDDIIIVIKPIAISSTPICAKRAGTHIPHDPTNR